MPKNRKKRKSRTISAPSGGIRPMLLICLRSALISYFIFLLAAAFLAWIGIRKETAPSVNVQTILLFTSCGLSFFLCGFLASHHNKFTAASVGFFSGFMLLILLVFTLFLASKGSFSVRICIPIAMGLLCPVLGSLVGKRI